MKQIIRKIRENGKELAICGVLAIYIITGIYCLGMILWAIFGY